MCCKLGFFPVFFFSTCSCVHACDFLLSWCRCVCAVLELSLCGSQPSEFYGGHMITQQSNQFIFMLYRSFCCCLEKRVLVLTAWYEPTCIAVPSGVHRQRSPGLEPAPCIFCVVSQAGYGLGVTVCWFWLRNHAEMVLPSLLNDSLILCGSHT